MQDYDDLDDEGAEASDAPYPDVAGRDPVDVILHVGVAAPREGITLADMLTKARKKMTEDGRDTLAQATLNTRFVAGRQFFQLAPRSSTATFLSPMTWSPKVPQRMRNLLGNNARTWTSRVLDKIPGTQAWPNNPTDTDVEVVAMANAYLGYLRRNNDDPSMLMRAGALVQNGGSVAFSPVWDPSKGSKMPAVQGVDEYGQPVDDGQEPQGEQVVRLLSVFDFVTDGAEFVEDATWCAIRTSHSENEARAILHEHGVSRDEEPKRAENAIDLWGEHSDPVVESWEVWALPSSTVPAGLYALVVGDVTACVMDFPYEHGELPLCVWKCVERDSSQWGDTHVTDALPQQTSLNEMLSMQARLVRLKADVFFVGLKSVVDDFENGETFTTVGSVEEVQRPGQFIQTPDISRDIYEAMDRAQAAISETFGIAETVATGGDPSSTKSAKQLAYISELDGQKLAPTRASLTKAMIRLDRQRLRLAQQFVRDDRIIPVTGMESAPYIGAFRAAHMGGVDVVLEGSSLALQTHAAGANAAEQDLQAGIVDPASGQELRSSGLTTTSGDGRARLVVQQQVAQLLAGQVPQPDPSVPTGVAIRELGLMLSMLPDADPSHEAILMLLAEYRAQAASAPAPAPSPHPAQPEIPGVTNEVMP